MKNRMFTFLFAALTSLVGFAQQTAQKPLVIELWPNGAPNSNEVTGPEVSSDPSHVSNVSNPTITVYPAAKPNGKVIIACPGGAYMNLAIEKEGHSMAKWLNHQGVTLAVLKYRLPNGHFETTVSDALEAIKIMRKRAAEWGADPHKIGIMGCSAGGNLAIQAATKFTSAEDRPDFQVLLYAFTTMNPFINKIMMGENASEAEIQKFTVMNHVTENTPPAFIACSADDPVVPCTDSVDYFKALRKFKTEATLHVYPTGSHGWGFADDFFFKREWTGELEAWLRTF